MSPRDVFLGFPFFPSAVIPHDRLPSRLVCSSLWWLLWLLFIVIIVTGWRRPVDTHFRGTFNLSKHLFVYVGRWTCSLRNILNSVSYLTLVRTGSLVAVLYLTACRMCIMLYVVCRVCMKEKLLLFWRCQHSGTPVYHESGMNPACNLVPVRVYIDTFIGI